MNNVFKPKVEKWKAFTADLQIQFSQLNAEYKRQLETTTSTTSTTTTTTTTTSTTATQIEYVLTDFLILSNGEPELILPPRPEKREQKPNEKGNSYKNYIENVYKPSIENWKNFTDTLEAEYQSELEKFALLQAEGGFQIENFTKGAFVKNSKVISKFANNQFENLKVKPKSLSRWYPWL